MVDSIIAANAGSGPQEQRHDISSLRFGAGTEVWNSMITVDDSPWGRSNAGYGQTEVAGMLTYHGLGSNGLGTHGRPSPMVQLRIVDQHWDDIPDGETGEMIARGLHVFDGYFERPDLNSRKFHRGWMRTGDLGRREVDGTVTFVGPASRMIKSGGENIYPAEVEKTLSAHPRVKSVAVIGRPDPAWGQSVTAIVVADGQVDEHELISFFRDRVASYKKPRTVIFAETIPMSGWFPDYDSLDRIYGGGGYPGS
jgi:long-chain acyl-CoA synthetase